MSHSISLISVTLIALVCTFTFAAPVSYTASCNPSISVTYVAPSDATTLNDGDFIQVTVDRGTVLLNDLLFVTDSAGNVIDSNVPVDHVQQAGQTKDQIQLLSTTLGVVQTRYIKYLACQPNSGIVRTSTGYACGTNGAQICLVDGQLFTINPVVVQLVSGNSNYFPNTPNLPNPYNVPIVLGQFCIQVPPLNFYHPSTVSLAYLSILVNGTTYTSNCEVSQVGSRTSQGAVRLWQVSCRPCILTFSSINDYAPSFANIHTLNVGDSNQVYPFNYQASMCGFIAVDYASQSFDANPRVVKFPSYKSIDAPLQFALFSNTLQGPVTTTIGGFTYNCATTTVDAFGISDVDCNPASLGIIGYLSPGTYTATTTATTAFTSCSFSNTIQVLPTSCGMFSLSTQVALPGQTVTINFDFNQLVNTSTTAIDVIVSGATTIIQTINVINPQPITFVAPTTISTVPYDLFISACSQSVEYCAVCSTSQTLQLYVGSFFGTQPQLSASTLSLSDTLYVNQFAVQSTQSIGNQLSVTVNWGDSTTDTCTLLSTDLSNFFTVSCPNKNYLATGTYTVTFTASYNSVSQTVTRTVEVTIARSCGTLSIPTTTVEGTLTRVLFTPQQTDFNSYGYLVTVNWGDGTTLTYTSDVNRNYDISHIYGGSQATATIQVTVSANFVSNPSLNTVKCSLSQSQSISIANVPPKIDKWTPSRTAVKNIPYFPAIAYCSDRGYSNTHTATIQYGSGTPTSCTIATLDDGKFNVRCPSNTFTQAGTYQLVLTVNDQRGGNDVKSATVVVS